MKRLVASATVLAAGLVAHAAIVGDGSVIVTPDVAVVQVPAGSGSGTATLTNTTSSTSFLIALGSDASCAPGVGLTVPGGSPTSLPASSSKQLAISCATTTTSGMRRCLYHATDSSTGAPLADFLAVCEYASLATLQPAATLVDLGTVAVGDVSTMTLALANTSSTSITKLFLQTTDLDGNFQFSTPCNPDAAYCDGTIAPVGQGSSAAIQIKCTPRTAGTHTAQLLVATDTHQRLSTGVTLQCNGTATTSPVLAVTPSSVTIASPPEVVGGTAHAVVHLANTGGGTLLVSDVRVVDVDTGAAMDWTYTATGTCSGQFPPTCMLGGGTQTDLDLTFDPSQIGTRRASLLVSYHDTIDRTVSIPLDGSGLGATLDLVGSQTVLDLGVVAVGHPASLDVQLANHGNRDTTAMLSLMPTTGPFSLSPASSAVVTPTAPKAITLTCNPTAAGTFTATFTAQSSDAFSSVPLVLTATCEGSTSPLYASPTALALGEVRIGEGQVRKTVQLVSATAPQQVTLSGVPALETPSSNLTVGALASTTTPTSFDVMVMPQSEGDLADHVTISDTDGDTVRIPVTGHVVKATYTVPTQVDVGTFCVNQPTTSSNVALTSTGTATIGLAAPALAGTSSAFALTYTSPSVYPSALVAGRSAGVALTPQRQTAATSIADMLTWTTDVAAQPAAVTAISAKFIDSGGAIAPPSLDFGKVLVHLYQDDGQRVMIQNCNSTTLMLDPPAIKAPFFIDSPNFPTMLNPNETTTFSVGFHPTKLGVFQDTLVISSPQLAGTPLQVALSGEGASDGSSGGGDAGTGSASTGNTSFYACSCTSSGPGGGLPIVLAVLLIVRRRRGSS